MSNKNLFLLLGILLMLSSEISAQTPDTSIYNALEYRLVGPFRGGRSAAVTGVPGRSDLFYMGSTGGGVWRTTNGGKEWENISDGFFGGSIGAVEVAKSDPNVIYVGGGEKTLRGNVSSGYGIWKTVDAGKSWKHIGLKNSRHIPRIRVHPTNADIVYAGVLGNIYKSSDERGVYKSTDGGKTWRKTLFSNSDAGVVDLIIDPNNYRVLYATTWNARRTPYSLSSGGEGSALWKSTDEGETWKEISKNEGFAKGILGIMGITVSAANSNRLYAMVENKKQGGLYTSTDGGIKWKKINSARKLRQRAWYYTRLYADTKDENTVYVLNVRYHKSTNGGKSFSTYNAPHGDHHDLWIAPENPNRMIIGDDGGAQVTYDGGRNWSTYENQPTAQFYRVTTDNAFPYRIYVAQQDNSTIRIPHRTEGRSISASDWERTAGGESAHIAVDPENDEIVYGGSYDGFLTRKNHEKNTIRSISVWPDNPMGHGVEDMKYRFQWNFPIIFSKHNPNRLYTFSQHVHVSENEGQSWKVISPDLTRNDSLKMKSSGGPITQDNTSVEYYCTIFAATESPLKEGLLWVGSDDGLIHLSRDGGENWENVTPEGMPEWMMINSVEASVFDEGTAYVAGTRYKSGDFKPYIYKTTNYGKTWNKMTNGIPDEHFTRVVREDPKKEGLLYAGTETGMYISFDSGNNWRPFQLNLPIVPITDLTIKDNNLIVATQGRSVWIIDDLSLLHQATSVKKNTNHLFKPKDTYRMGGGARSRKSLTEGANHPTGVMTYFNIKEFDSKKDTIVLTYLNAGGDTLQMFSSFAKEKKDSLAIKKGGNLFAWNTRIDGAESLKGMILWWANLNGPKAVPGDYKVSLDINGERQIQPFKILPNPNAEATVADMKKQHEFISDINKTVDRAHQSIKKIRKINKQLKTFEKQYKEDDRTAELREKAKKMRESFGNIEKELYQTQNRSGQDPLNFPIRLTNKLGHLNSLVGMGDFGPTDQDVEVKNQLSASIKKQLTAFDKMLDDEVAQFNADFNKLNLQYLFVD